MIRVYTVMKLQSCQIKEEFELFIFVFPLWNLLLSTIYILSIVEVTIRARNYKGNCDFMRVMIVYRAIIS